MLCHSNDNVAQLCCTLKLWLRIRFTLEQTSGVCVSSSRKSYFLPYGSCPSDDSQHLMEEHGQFHGLS